MIAANYTEFRTNLKELLDTVEEDNEMVIVKRGKGKGSVLISLSEYNSIIETMHLLSSNANAMNLYASLKELNEGKGKGKDLIED
jgi:antitoxin YefM